MVDARSVVKYLVPLTIFSVPFGGYSIETGFVNLSAPNLLILVTFVFFLLKYRRHALRLTRPQLLTLGLFSLLIVQQAVSTLIYAGSPRPLVTFLGYLLFVAAIFIYVDSTRDLKRLLSAAFLSAVIIGLLTIVHILQFPEGLPSGIGYSYGGGRTIAGYTIPFRRSLGIQASYGAFGMYTMMATPYFAYLAIKRRSAPIFLGVGVVLLGIFMSQSRSTWGATGAALFIVALGYCFGSPRRWVRYAGIAGAALAAVVAPILTQILISADPRTVDTRVNLYREGVDIIVANPLLGVGFGYLEQYYTGTTAIHSAFMNLTVRTGIIALLLALAIWACGVFYLGRGMLSSSERLAFSIGMYGSLVAMVIESNLQPGFTKAPWIVLAFALAVYSVHAFAEDDSGNESRASTIE